MSLYSRKDILVLAFVAGLITGMVVAFSACSPPDSQELHSHVTSGGNFE